MFHLLSLAVSGFPQKMNSINFMISSHPPTFMFSSHASKYEVKVRGTSRSTSVEGSFSMQLNYLSPRSNQHCFDSLINLQQLLRNPYSQRRRSDGFKGTYSSSFVPFAGLCICCNITSSAESSNLATQSSSFEKSSGKVLFAMNSTVHCRTIVAISSIDERRTFMTFVEARKSHDRRQNGYACGPIPKRSILNESNSTNIMSFQNLYLSTDPIEEWQPSHLQTKDTSFFTISIRLCHFSDSLCD